MSRTPDHDLPYSEGTIFAVPLRDSGFAVGVVARADGRGKALGYFFGPRVLRVPNASQLGILRPSQAILVTMFGDLGLIEGAWEIIGSVRNWERDQWPVPEFVRVDEHEGKAWLSRYDDKTLEHLEETRCSPDLAEDYPYDRLSGAGAVEIRLTRALAVS